LNRSCLRHAEFDQGCNKVVDGVPFDLSFEDVTGGIDAGLGKLGQSREAGSGGEDLLTAWAQVMRT